MRDDSEYKFLNGPRSRTEEFVFTIKILFEFIRGLRAFHFLGPCVTVFGSARYKSDHHFYKSAEEIAFRIARHGFTIMTGGGPGIMEAANKGARNAGGKSVGCNIVLGHEEGTNKFLDKWVTMHYFFVRKVFLHKFSYAFIVMPGGFGTLDEFFEAITLIQTGKTKPFPVVLFGKEFHQHLYEHIKLMQSQGTISQADSELFLFTDSVDEVITHIEKYAIDKFEMKRIKVIKPSVWLGEKG